MNNNRDKILPEHKKRVTIKDIASHTGYSIATVSRVLNQSGMFYSKKTCEKIQEAVKELNYHPDGIARGLKTKKTYNIAFLEPWTAEFFFEIFIGVQKAAAEAGYTVAIFSSNYNTGQEKRNVDAILSNRLDGVIVPSAILENESILRIVENDIPVVIIEKFVSDNRIPYISIKNYDISKKAVNYLISLGHKRIGFIAEPLSVGKVEARFRGYREALAENGIELDSSIIFIDEILMGEEFSKSYEYILKNLELIKKCTALFIISDKSAISAIKALKESGVKVPEDISIIGFDGLEISRFINPTLTTIVQPRFEMGYKAMKMLLDKINKNPVESVELKAELFIGDSTSP
ncbi:MAG: LacI family transcriptional regulator, partial [Actinobacteria bacterium]|nr:LacI family transcriptional regulator [Actinomycetota bacterium]